MALTAAGFPITASTLATLGSRGGGPDFERFGNRPCYVWGTVLAWAKNRRSAPLRKQRAAA